MKLTQRQLDKIAGLINEEANVRKELHESMYSNRKQSIVNEMLMTEAELSIESVPDYLRMAIEDEFSSSPNSILSALLSAVNPLLYERLSDLMEKAGKEAWNPVDFEDFLTEAEQELNRDLEGILQTYAMNIANVAVETLSSNDDLEPRYSEYE